MRRIIITLLGLTISIASVGYVGNQARSTGPKDPLTRNPATSAIVEANLASATALGLCAFECGCGEHNFAHRPRRDLSQRSDNNARHRRSNRLIAGERISI